MNAVISDEDDGKPPSKKESIENNILKNFYKSNLTAKRYLGQ